MARPKDRLHKVIIVGATPAGIAAASKLGELGIPVILVDPDPDLDRKLADDPWRLPSGLPLNFAYRPGLIRILRNPAIRCVLPAHVLSLKHTPQGFRARIRTSRTYIDPERCILCGRCIEVCPVSLPDGGKPLRFAGRQALPGRPVIEKSRQPLCQAECPLGVNAQAYIAFTRVGRFHEALDVIRRDNVLPGICGRICTHPCEAACRRSELDEPLAIRDIKRFAADYERDHPHTPLTPDVPKREKKIAVVGSGPAGLAASAELGRLGYPVTVFEREAELGGLLRYGIGPHRLPRDVLDDDLDYIKRCGVSFVASHEIDLSDSLGRLRDEFEAVIVAVGSWKDRNLEAPGENLTGVEGCLSLLNRLYRERVSTEPQDTAHPAVEKGEALAVIGDGNAAFDAARTLRRLGGDVTIVSWFSEDRMPADREEVRQAKEEGIRVIDQTQVTAFAGPNGKLTHLICRPTQPGPSDANGIEWPVIIPESKTSDLPFSRAIVAIGQSGPFTAGVLASKTGDPGLQSTSYGFLKVDADGRTNMDRVYAAGDGVTGPSSVVQAMASGRRVAVSVHAALSGEPTVQNGASRPEDRDYPKIPEDIPSLARPAMPERQPSIRKDNFSEVALGLSESQVVFEADRCLQCGICSECLLCTEVCGPLKAIHHQEQAEETVEHAGVVIIADPDAAPAIKGEDVLRAYGPRAAKPDVNAMLVRGFAAAAQAMVLLGGTSQRPRGRGVSFLPPDPELSPDIRMGVFVCRCNDAFGWLEEMNQYVEALTQREDIVHAEVMASACVAEGTAGILRAIREKGLTRVVLASCVCCPLDFVCSACTDQRGRLKDALFHGTGVSRAMAETCNLRGEALRYLAHDRDAALKRFIGLIDRSITRARTLRPLPAPVRIYNFATAVIGESEAAVSSARTLASAGLEVFLFGTRERPLSTLLDHPNIHCFKGSRVNGMTGNLGDFQIFVETEGFSQAMQVGAIILGERAKRVIPYIPQKGLPSFILPSSLQKSGLSGIPFFSPGATPIAGLFNACPSGIPVSQRRAGAAAAALAAAVMPRGPRQSKGFTVVVDEDRCRGCGRCTRICPYQAVTLHQNGVGGWVARVDEALCKGCGNCISVCPSNAADSPYRNQGYLEELLGAVLVSSREGN
jgi:NADPH-dependent glutamate synthase beta subunit-like oxidoreductase/NAD-dependent dihydropyrimidine dehydrogenase PreA subunit